MPMRLPDEVGTKHRKGTQGTRKLSVFGQNVTKKEFLNQISICKKSLGDTYI